jgi:hypothetical protein
MGTVDFKADFCPIAVGSSNTRIVGSQPTRGMDVSVCLVFVLSCVGRGLAMGCSLGHGNLKLPVRLAVTQATVNAEQHKP